MMDKAGDSQRYVDFLDRLLDTLPIHGFQPVIVLHDRFEDQALLGMIASRHAAIPALRHDDSTALKGILSQAAIVVGSRYHALASAMSQGVPAIGCGWSHKYSALFEDFGAPEFLLSDIGDIEALDRLLSIMSDPAVRRSAHQALVARSSALQIMSEAMWAEVEDLIVNMTRAPQP
jgi:colanic acid/amylovoran biosynthesis protein